MIFYTYDEKLFDLSLFMLNSITPNVGDMHDVYSIDIGMNAYGLDIELGGDVRTTRSVFVVDKDGVIQYKQIVDEVADEPDYDSALEAADKL